MLLTTAHRHSQTGHNTKIPSKFAHLTSCCTCIMRKNASEYHFPTIELNNFLGRGITPPQAPLLQYAKPRDDITRMCAVPMQLLMVHNGACSGLCLGF